MSDIVQTGKRYKGYGVDLREYCNGIGISLSRWYRMQRMVHTGMKAKDKQKPKASPYALTQEEEEAVVAYAVAHPKYYHREMAYRMIDENVVYTSPSTVYRILKKHGLIRENVHKKRYDWVHRYSNQAQSPDELWQADITYVQYKQRDVYVLSFIDVYSRFVVLSELLANMESGTVSRVFQRFVEGVQDSLYQVPRLQTDNGSCFIGTEFRSVVQQYVKEHTTIHPATPTENVIIERWNRTYKELLYEMDEPEDLHELVENTRQACYYYNYERYHQSLGYVTPYEWYRGNPQRIYEERERKKREARKYRCAVNMMNDRNYSLSLTPKNSHFV